MEGMQMAPAPLTGTDLYFALGILALPLAASLLTLLFGKRMWRGGAIFPIAAIAGSLVLALKFFAGMIQGHAALGWSTSWFHVGSPSPVGFDFPFGVLLDNLSIWLATLVALLSLLIVIFSTHYLHEEPNHKLARYYAVKSLFVAGMLGTVILDNYFLLFVFWEVMGLCSYLLIGYWYERDSAAIAAKKAFLTTRLGDIFLFLGLVILFVTFHTLSYHELFASDLAGHRAAVFWAGLLIFGGAVGKSAQFPLDIWLPDAMEGPTTVSALIHAATMVKAGVYLVARTWPLYVALGLGAGLTGETLFTIIGCIGGFTALYTATMALAATDIKRVLAFSTLSQLGYMFLALGAGGVLFLHTGSAAGFAAAMLHLMNHAFFKALLFLGAGSVIMGMHHHQDLREMGGLAKKMKTTHLTMLLGSLSIAGIIPLSGFWSKDEVLSAAFSAGHEQPVFTLMYIMGVLTALLTAFYMFRMMWLAFYGKPRTESAEHAHESPVVMTAPLAILSVFAVVSGLWLILAFAGGFGHMITQPIAAFASPSGHEFEVAGPSDALHEILVSPLTYLSLAAAVAGIAFAWSRYKAGLPRSEEATPTKGWRGLLYNRYYVTQLVYEPLGNYLGYGVAKVSSWFDRRGIDGAVNGIANITSGTGGQVRRWQDGRLTTYMASIAIGALLLLVFLNLGVMRFW